MTGDVKMQAIKRKTGRSLTGDRPLFLALMTALGFHTADRAFCAIAKFDFHRIFFVTKRTVYAQRKHKQWKSLFLNMIGC